MKRIALILSGLLVAFFMSACGGGGSGGGLIGEAQAQTAPAPQGWIQHIDAVLEAKLKVVKTFVSQKVGYVSAAVMGLSQCDTNGIGCTAVGGYFSAECIGVPGRVQDECVGSYSRVDCTGAYWCAGGHAEFWDSRPDHAGGTLIGSNIELKGSSINPGRIGVNLQPDPASRDVVGFNFQHPQAYAYAINLNGAKIRLGDHAGVPICMQLVQGQIAVAPC